MPVQDVYVALMEYLSALKQESGAESPEEAAALRQQTARAHLAYQNILQAYALRLPGVTLTLPEPDDGSQLPGDEERG